MSPGMWNEKICRLPVSVSEPVQDQAALSRAVAFPHEILIRADSLGGPADIAEHVRLVLRENEDALQLMDERRCGGGGIHDGLPQARCRGSTHLSQPVTPGVISQPIFLCKPDMR